MDSKAREIDGSQFREVVLENRKPVMVDFYAEWCGPCRLMSPVVDRLAGEWSDRVEIVKVNTEKAGETIARLVGFRGEDGLRRELKRAEEICAEYSRSSDSPDSEHREGAD